jgi:flagellar hook-basal body complex protein FliE
MDSFMVNMLRFSEFKKEEGKITQPETSTVSEATSFEKLLVSSMKQVNDLQLESDKMVQKLATGDVEDISEVVLASSRAEIALKMFMELRNKFVDAYQQLSRMSA